VEEDINKNKTEVNVDFFETIIIVVESKSREHQIET
jgi:hypothetical protein